MMTAKDFRQEQDYPYNHFTKLTSTGISPDYEHIEEYAEAYYQAKVKNLGVHGVSQRSGLLDFMNFISKTPQAEIEMYSNEELVDGYLKANCG